MTKIKGDCEACVDSLDVELVLTQPGNILMCPECLAKHKAVTSLLASDSFRKLETRPIEIKQDLFNAGTVSFIELQARIEADSTIPASGKNIAIMEEVAARIKALDAVIFAEDAALLVKKNERHALLVNAQNVAAKLHEKDREKYKQFDVTYKPVTPKSVKPKAIVKKAKSFSMTELKAAAAKYNLPILQVQRVAVAHNLSAEDAAKKLAALL